MKRTALLTTALLMSAVTLLLAATPALAAERYELVLAGRRYVPAEVKVARSEDSHLVVQFFEIPTQAEREELARGGITLLDYIPNYAWTAHVKGGAVQALEPGRIRAVFALRPEDKVARSAEGREIVRAFVYDGVEGAAGVLSAYGRIVGQDGDSFTLTLERDVLELAAEDIVKYVMGPRPDKTEDNDEIRDNINADEVQAAPYGLSGAGVTAGMWDNGSAATNHSDYNSRLTVGDGSSVGSHPAQVCGVMAGDGTRSTVYGGYANQWAGVAPGVDIASYSWPDDLANMDAEHSHAISNYDIILSQNSWSWDLCPSYCYYFGTYDDWSQNFDKLVRGSQGKRISVVFSAGNEGNCTACASELPDFPYGTVSGPGSTAKNTIVVGSNDADDDDLSYYSSRGPTLDGRLKPDVAAPGCKSYEGITTTYTSNNYYSGSCGTSFSAPAVSGCVAVLMEDYIDKFGGEAWPSTVKGLIIQGAEDQGNVGPDFEFGFGRVNIQNTVDIIRADDGTYDLIKEDTLSPAETWEYEIDVTGGGDLKVTLVWDDFEGDYGAGGVMLVNDLDLELEAPGGGVYYPWVLDPDNPSLVATTGADHLNNVEQVEVISPASGTWTVRVTATVMPEPNQDFSVVTSHGAAVTDPPPDAPTGLDADPGTNEGEIDVSWNPNSEPDLDYYVLERADNPAFSGSTTFNVYTTSYTDTGLTPGQTYYYRVFAVDDGANTSDPSLTASSDAQDLSPSPPTALNAMTGAGEGEINIAWNPSPESDVVQYRLERASNPSFSGAASLYTTDPLYADSGLTPGEPYYYRVFAIDAGAHESGPSNVDSAAAQDLPPAAPVGLVAVTGTDEGEIDVTWSASPEPDFDHYRLERDDDGFFGPGSDPFDTPATFFPDSGLVPGATYYYRVIAVDAGGNESPPSNVDSAAAQDLPPAAPTGLVAATGTGEGEIDISWNPNSESDFDHYRLERDDDGFFGPGSDPFDTPATFFPDSGLYPGETYYYRVIAIDTGGNESPPSNVDFADARDLPPGAPTGLVATTGSAEGEIDLVWDSNEEVDHSHYRVERSDDPGFSSPVSFTAPGASATDSGLVPGDTYYYRIYAVDLGANESGPSDVDSADAQDLPPAAPTGLVAVTGAGEGEIDISWNPNSESDLDHYRLERDDDGFFGPGSDPFDTPATFFPDSGLDPGHTYYYRVIAVDANGNESGPSNVDSAAAQDLPPAAPTGLVAVTGAAEGEIDVSWNPNSESDLDHYRLERDDDGFFGPGSDPFDTPAAFFPDSGLYPGDTYYYRVIAVDAHGNESEPSDVDFAAAQDLAPAAPTGLDAVTGIGEGEIDISWDANSEPDIDHYRLERDTDGGFPSPTSFEVGGTSYFDSGLVPGDTYYYRVHAVDAALNESPPSGTDSAPAADLPPASPTGLSCAPAPVEYGIDLSWDANPDADFDHYRVERDIDAGFGSPTSFDAYTESYEDRGLLTVVLYHYRVFAVDAGGNESTASDPCSSQATDLPPDPPIGLVAVPGTVDGQIYISWTEPSHPDIGSYSLERDTDPGFPSPVVLGPSVDYYYDSGLAKGTTYYYRAFTIDLGGNTSGPSNVDSALPFDEAPAAPTGLVATSGVAEGEISASWNPNSEPDLDHYVVQRDTDPAFTAPFEADAFTEAYVDGGLTPGQLYYYRVIAIDTYSNASAPSVPDSATATDLPPSTPAGFTAVPGAAEGEIDLSWDANPEPDIHHYWLDRDTTAVFGSGTIGSLVPGTSITQRDLPPDTYYYRLKAADDAWQESAPSETLSVTLEVTGVEEVLVASVSFVKPNPFRSETSIHYTVPTEGGVVTIRLYDIRGRLVRTLVDRPRGGGAYEAVWDGRDDSGGRLSAGVYFCRAEIGEWTDMRKMVLIR